jgi:hypothetical protein
MSHSIIPTITWVNPELAASGRTVKVLLTHESFAAGVSHFAYIPAGAAPRKWDRVEATTVKVGEVQYDYTDTLTGDVVALKVPRAQVSFFGDIALMDPAPIQPTQWVDKRTSAPATSTVSDNEPF